MTLVAKFDVPPVLIILDPMQRHRPFVFFILLFLSACDLLGSGSPTELATPAPSPTATDIPPLLQETPEFTAPPLSATTHPTLTLWLPPEIIGRTDASAKVLEEQLAAFDDNYPGLQIRLEQKAVGGQGSILNYLRTGHNVAPTALPDLVVLPVEQLATAATEELIYPLNNLLDPALVDDLYPAARTWAQSGEEIVGYPFALTELSHLAYNRNVITTTLPLVWSDFISNTNGGFAFPAAGPAGAVLALQLYLAAGGALVGEAGQPILQPEPLTVVLEQFSQGRDRGFILAQSSNTDTLDESWQLFQNGSAAVVLTTAGQFIRQGFVDLPPGFAALPGFDEPLVPLIAGWAWAISTPDPVRQAQAAELLTMLTSEHSLGQWSYQSAILPGRRAAFVQWPPNDPYVRFVQQELERAQPSPISANSSTMNALRNAVFDVISMTKTPQVAAREAAESLQP